MDIRCFKNRFVSSFQGWPLKKKHVIEGNTETPHLTMQMQWIHVTFHPLI
jgi:hypothetical protein